MAQRASFLYRKTEQVDSHIDKVMASLGWVALSRQPTSQELLRRRIVSAFVILLLVVYSVSPLFVKANTVIFYPSACLGGWQDVSKASGEPDAQEHYNESNSAVLAENIHAEIYCGSFSGKEMDGALPTTAEIIFHWSTTRSLPNPETAPHIEIIGESFASSTADILDSNSSSTVSFTTATSSGETTQNEEVIVTEEEKPNSDANVEATESSAPKAEPEQTTESVVSEPQPEQTTAETLPPVEETSPQSENTNATPTETEPVSLSSFFNFFASLIVASAYAQEEAPVEEVVQTTQTTPAEPAEEIKSVSVGSEDNSAVSVETTNKQETETPVVESEEVIETKEEAPIVQEDIVTASTTDDSLTATTTEEVASSTPVTVPEETSGEFLLVSYTTDGTSWKELVKVSPQQINETSYMLEIEGLTWQKLANVQIRIETLSTIDETVSIFLDAMELRINYKEIEKEDILPEVPVPFAKDGITGIKGVTGNIVFLKEKNGEKEVLSLYNLTDKNKQEIAIHQEISDTFPVGFKGERMFLLTKDLKTLIAYDLESNKYDEVLVPPFDISSGERARVKVEGFPWTILIGGENFYFHSDETGEVFSDEDSGFVNAVETNAVTDTILNKEKLEELNFLKKEEPEVVGVDESL